MLILKKYLDSSLHKYNFSFGILEGYSYYAFKILLAH